MSSMGVQDSHPMASDIASSVLIGERVPADGRNFYAWLYVMCKNEVCRSIRYGKRFMGISGSDCGTESEYGEEALHATPSSLDASDSLLLSRMLEGYSQRDVAREMGVSPSLLNKRLKGRIRHSISKQT